MYAQDESACCSPPLPFCMFVKTLLHRFIAALRPQSPQQYDLVTTFPNRRLSDDAATLAQLDMANCVVTQRPRAS